MRASAWALVLAGLIGCGADRDGLTFVEIREAWRVIAPREGGLVNRARPIIRWEALPGAGSYFVEVYRDRAAVDLVERGAPTSDTLYRLTSELVDDRDYYVRVVGLMGLGGTLARSPLVYCRTRLMPDWVPEFELVAHDAVGVADGYRLTNLINVSPAVPNEPHGALVLFNRSGEIVWMHDQDGDFGAVTGQTLTDDGTILYVFRPTDRHGAGYEIDLNRNVHWISREGPWLHHEVGNGPDGNRAYLYWIFEEYDGDLYEGDGIELVDPDTNEVLWSWNIFDHFDPAEFQVPELAREGISRIGALDWSHSNAVIWDEARSVFWVSVRHFDRLIGVDYPSGEVVITLGQGGIGGDGLMSHQHAPELQPDGSILLWDNGNGYSPPFSRAVQYSFDAEAGTYQRLFEWHDEPTFFDRAVGDANRLPNGNTLITAGVSGRIIEVDAAGRIVWDLRMEADSGFWNYRCLQVPESWIPAGMRAPAD